jgi:hypothetical protein
VRTRTRRATSSGCEEAVAAAEPEIQSATGDFLREGYTRLKTYAKDGQLLHLPSTAYMPLLLGPAQELLRYWASGRGELKPGIEKVLADAAWRCLRPESPPRKTP